MDKFHNKTNEFVPAKLPGPKGSNSTIKESPSSQTLTLHIAMTLNAVLAANIFDSFDPLTSLFVYILICGRYNINTKNMYSTHKNLMAFALNRHNLTITQRNGLTSSGNARQDEK